MTYSLKTPLSFPAMSKLSKPVRWQLAGMIAATVAWVLAAVCGVVVAIVSPIVFDGRGSVFNPLAWLGFLLMISFWAVCLVAPFVGWVFWVRAQMPRAWACMALPLAWGVLTLAVLQFVPAK